MFRRSGVLKGFVKFTGKKLAYSPFLVNVYAPVHMFSCEFSDFFLNSTSSEHLWMALLEESGTESASPLMKKTAWKKTPQVNSILSPYFIFFPPTLSPTSYAQILVTSSTSHHTNRNQGFVVSLSILSKCSISIPSEKLSIVVYCSINIRNYRIICQKKRLLFSFFYCCQRQNYIKIKMKKIRIRLNTAFRKVGEPKCLPRKAKGGGEGVTLTWWTRKFAVSFFWQNFYFPLVYSYLNRLFFVEILKIKKDLAGALQGVLRLLPYFSLVNCMALA